MQLYLKKSKINDASNFKLKENLKLSSFNDSILIQSEDKKIFKEKNFKVVSKKPNKKQLENLYLL